MPVVACEHHLAAATAAQRLAVDPDFVERSQLQRGRRTGFREYQF